MHSGSGTGPGVQKACASIATNLHFKGKCGIFRPIDNGNFPTTQFENGLIPNLVPKTDRHFFCNAFAGWNVKSQQYFDGHVVCPKNWIFQKSTDNYPSKTCFITEGHLNNVPSADKCPETIFRNGALYPYDSATKRCIVTNPPKIPCNNALETWDGSKCQPKTPCPNNTVWDGATCKSPPKCLPDEVLVGLECKKIPKCLPDEILVGFTCEKKPKKCKINEILNGTQCVKRVPNCNSGSTLQNGICIPQEKNGDCDQPD